MTPDQFPTLLEASQSKSRFCESVTLLALSMEGGPLKKVDFIRAEDAASDAFCRAWNDIVRKPFFHASNHLDLSPDVLNLEHSIDIVSIQSAIAASYKLERTEASGAAVTAMKRLAQEALPLARALSLASKPSKVTRPTPIKAGSTRSTVAQVAADIKTCPCCARSIEVVGGAIAAHAPRSGGIAWPVAECPGSAFKPLEESAQGLEWLIGETKRQKDALVEELYSLKNRHLDTSDPFPVSTLTDGKRADVDRSSPDWPSAVHAILTRKERDARVISGHLKDLEKRLSEWRPTRGRARKETVSPRPWMHRQPTHGRAHASF